jgi:cytochrome c-type biogenesis protein CcmH
MRSVMASMTRARALGTNGAGRVVVLVVMLLALASTVALAVEPDEMLKDPKLEARARALSRELRCMVCQNQSIDDSEAPLARDLRILVRERLAAGDSDADVLRFLVARYGEFVLLRPRFDSRTFLLWVLPPGLLAGGALALLLFARRRMRAATPTEPELSPSERERLHRLLEREKAGPG